MGMLDGCANRTKKSQAIFYRQRVFVAKVGDGYAFHVLHDQIRPAIVVYAAIQ
jgi:hypothetical protein